MLGHAVVVLQARLRFRFVKCPTCGDGLPADARDPDANPAFPFCTDRCKMIDLGHWFAEDYKISRPVEGSDLPDSLPEDSDSA